MSPRVTRSAARLRAESDSRPSSSTAPTSPPASRKRKATAESPTPAQPSRRSKRVRGDAEAERTRGKSRATDMSAPSSARDATPQQSPQSSSRRKSSRRKSGNTDVANTTTGSASRKSKKAAKKAQDVAMKDADREASQRDTEAEAPRPEEEEDAESEEDVDPFSRGLLDSLAGPGRYNPFRMFGDLMTGSPQRFRGMLEQLKTSDDQMVQMAALQELSEALLMTNEDALSGNFPSDQFIEQLVALMQPSPFQEANVELMLLACRCLGNLMEALPSATVNVVYGNAVPVLCNMLLEMQFIDVAEQALTTLQKISTEFPASIVKEGGLRACLGNLDFFATSTQRTAVTTAANCCRNLQQEHFPAVLDVMPTLEDTLGGSDQKVVEQTSLCVSRIVDSFQSSPDKLEKLVRAKLLQAVLRLLLPGSTNMIGPAIHTQFLRLLSISARASPRLSVELLKMNVVDTLYQILTGVSAPAGMDNIASEIDQNIIMQAVIRTPKAQIYETLNVICEVLPTIARDDLIFLDDLQTKPQSGPPSVSMSTRSKKAPNEKKLELLKGCPDEVKRFSVILFPTLMYTFTSTVNLGVRQKVLDAQLKMLSNLDSNILEEALCGVPYASHLASILTQHEDSSLVTYALQAAELLLKRLESIYRPQFYREGVMAEIAKLAERPLQQGEGDEVEDDEDGEDVGNEYGGEDDHNHDDEDEDEDIHAYRAAMLRAFPLPDDVITMRAKKFIATHGNEGSPKMREKASHVLDSLQSLAADLQKAYSDDTATGGPNVFARLARYFDGSALEGITSYELMASNIVNVLLSIFETNDEKLASKAQGDLKEAFMPKGSSSASPFSIFVAKLQDLLSRAEHFEVLTVQHPTADSSRSSAAMMLSKQLRIKLVADENSGIPSHLRNIIVSIHAVATFKALDSYLRPRMSSMERPRSARREHLHSMMAAAYSIAAASRRIGSTESPAGGNTGNPFGGRASTSRPDDDWPLMTREGSSRPGRSRRQSSQAGASTQPPPANEEESQEPLECVDEAQIEEEDDDDDDLDADLDALVDELEDGGLEQDSADPSAVTVEVGNSGKVTARTDNGSRIQTPSTVASSQSRPAARQPSPREATPTPARQLSYASALQSEPQDWHIEFSVDGRPIPNDTTVFKACHFGQDVEVSSRNFWTTTHAIQFKKAPGPPPSSPGVASSSNASSSDTESGLPTSLEKHPLTCTILRLMSILHKFKDTAGSQAEAQSQFINTKLTAKLNRQLDEPLIVASQCLPTWIEDLTRLFPFLFPFQTRHLLLQSTSFGYSRSMARWQSSQLDNEARRVRVERLQLSRVQRQKVRIQRERILESAIKVMELYGHLQSVLEVEYFGEVGTGLGPTLEFYSTVSNEFSAKKTNMWRTNGLANTSEYAYSKTGLFPAPMTAKMATTEEGKRVLHMFKVLGRFVARSMLDSRIIDVNFNPYFFKIGTETPSLRAVAAVDPDLAQSLAMLSKYIVIKKEIVKDKRLSAQQKQLKLKHVRVHDATIEDLGLEFTLPGYPHIELVPGGATKDVTIDNIDLYVQKVIEVTVGSGVKQQADAFKRGFSKVFPFSALKAFTPDELVMLFGKAEEDWSLELLLDSIKADHGFNLDSKSVRNLLQVMSEYTPQERRDFLKFVTGSPKLPIGGEYRFKALTPMFTVVCKPSEPPLTSDDYLPSVMTCANYLKMPDYSSLEILREKIGVAIKEGQGAFHLS
ncbi:hypothetical protein K470DRAFT_264418 [Piedraia hortae CBS 480.64]|uniref:HECT-type E3 ubiquitin transferase n=1 Tax=Piedraia hortae CBS 480.64 TaxID=1314780 RepID=A0A6A7C102_9PEZI|nr:hypothetical protein K470DRAFT_264418 [Piedraia hortae CBS 480.64]